MAIFFRNTIYRFQLYDCVKRRPDSRHVYFNFQYLQYREYEFCKYITLKFQSQYK